MNDLFKQYAELKNQIKGLEEQIKALQPDVTMELLKRTEEMEDKNLKFDFGTFSISERKTWFYSEAIQELEDHLKMAKEAEELSGDAKSVITKSLRYQL